MMQTITREIKIVYLLLVVFSARDGMRTDQVLPVLTAYFLVLA